LVYKRQKIVDFNFVIFKVLQITIGMQAGDRQCAILRALATNYRPHLDVKVRNATNTSENSTVMEVNN
tara:strand:- start:35102 stop:35305 length:204 start_codon:yes stop_codon:yes gene_type:complete